MADDDDRHVPGDDADRHRPVGGSRAMRVFVVTVLALSCVGYAATLALESVGSEPVPGPSASPTEPPKCGGHGTGLPDCGLSDACVADAEHSVEPSDDGREAHGSAVVHLCAVVRPSGD